MSTSWECIAFNGQRVPNGENYVPGTDSCTVCKCEKGRPVLCRSALCQQPQDCKSFRIGESCCDFICLDDILPTLNKNPSSDAGLRMVASAITAILSVALLLFLIHRLRQRKLRTAQHQYFEDQLDALGGMPPDTYRNNTCCHSAIYLSGNDQVDFFLDGHTPPFSPWKPPSYYFEHGDAPPPYSEVIANDRARADRGPLPSLNPLMVQLSAPRVHQQTLRSLRTTLPQRNALLVPEAAAQAGQERQERREEAARSAQSNPVLNSALLSDQIYENSSAKETGTRQRPHSLYNPPMGLNDLNRGTSQSISSTNVYEARQDSSSPAHKQNSCQCEYSHNMEKCNVCSSSSQQAVSHNKNTGSRPRQKVCGGNPGRVEMEDFRLRLRLDMSSSSSSTSASSEGGPAPTHTGFSSSISSRSSEDMPSIDSCSTEANC